KAIATDNGGKTAEHSIQVTVDNNAAPVISITHPANGQTVSGTITVSADTDDDVVSVEFSIPDVLYLGTDEDGSDGWSVSWDTTGLPDGEYMMNARATDAGGKSTLSAPVWVVVDNTPTAFGITAPANGATVAGQVDVTTGCNDALLYVELYLDGEYLGEATLVDGVWVFPWDTTLVEDG